MKPNMLDHLPAYVIHLRGQGYAERTVTTYEAKAGGFCCWREQPAAPVTAQELRDWVTWLRTSGYSESAIRGYVAAVALFFQFLERYRLAERLPSLEVVRDLKPDKRCRGTGGRRWPNGAAPRRKRKWEALFPR